MNPARHSLPLIIILALTPTTVIANGESDDKRSRNSTVRVPQDAQTIQDGIEMVPDGGTVRIAAGTYVETLDIVGKHVDLVGDRRGSGRRTLIVGETPDDIVPVSRARGLINYGTGGGGGIANITLVGGDSAVLGIADVGTVPPNVRMRNVRMLRNGRGVTGTFGEMRLRNTVISQSLWHGMSACFQLLHLASTYITNSQQLGILAIGCQPNQQLVVDNNSNISGNLSGGVAVFGDVQVGITDSTFSGNSSFGILLVETQQTVFIINTIAEATLLADTPLYAGLGDGLIALRSGIVSMIGSSFFGNQRAGLMLVGNPTFGKFVASESSGNRFGLVLQNGATFVTIGPDNEITGNLEQNILADGELAVPAAPPTPTP
jgi:hypothetical protein